MFRAERSALRLLLFSLLLAAPAARSARAADCLAPLALNDKWACSAQLSNGASVDYCLQLTAAGEPGPNRSFDMVTTGPFPRTCTCGGKGKGTKTRFNAAPSYLCFDESTATAESGTITRKRIVGETFNVSVNVRSIFTCTPDPTCAVPIP